jgi:gamma-glutamyltranspeptidase
MPQYEFESTDSTTPALHRGRAPADAVARALGAEKREVDVSEEADEQGWQAVTVAGEPAGRVRDHAARMRFRRD